MLGTRGERPWKAVFIGFHVWWMLLAQVLRTAGKSRVTGLFEALGQRWLLPLKALMVWSELWKMWSFKCCVSIVSILSWIYWGSLSGANPFIAYVEFAQRWATGSCVLAPGVFAKNSFICSVGSGRDWLQGLVPVKQALSYIPSAGMTIRGYTAMDGNGSVGCVPHFEKHLYLACEINVQ